MKPMSNFRTEDVELALPEEVCALTPATCPCEEDFEDLHSFASNAPNASNVPTHTAADSPPSTASAASGGAAGGVAQPKRWTQDFEDDEEEHGS